MSDAKIRELLTGAGYDPDTLQHVLHAAGYVIAPAPGSDWSEHWTMRDFRIVERLVLDAAERRGERWDSPRPQEAVRLAAELHETAARFGITRDMLGAVTGVSSAAIEAVSMRDYQRAKGLERLARIRAEGIGRLADGTDR